MARKIALGHLLPQNHHKDRYKTISSLRIIIKTKIKPSPPSRNNLLRHQQLLPCSRLPPEQKANDSRMKPSNSTFRRLGSWAILNSNGAAKIKPKLGELLKSLEANKQDGVLQHQIPILQVQPSEALSSPQFSKIRFEFSSNSGHHHDDCDD